MPMPFSLPSAQQLDADDPLAACRERFTLPPGGIYLDGNSLGALPKSVAPRLARAVEHEWGVGLIRSWNDADWYPAPQRVGARISQLVGAAADEVICADSISVNLFKVLVAALRMKPGRTRDDEIIVFDSSGTALQDVAAAAAVYRRAAGQKPGVQFSFNA